MVSSMVLPQLGCVSVSAVMARSREEAARRANAAYDFVVEFYPSMCQKLTHALLRIPRWWNRKLGPAAVRHTSQIDGCPRPSFARRSVLAEFEVLC